MERIRCLAPLPEDSATPVLIRMLALAPREAPVRKGKEESERAQEDLGSGDKSDTESGEIDLSSPKDRGEKGSSIPSPRRRKRDASEDWEGQSSKRGKMPPASGLVWKAMPLNSSNKGTSPRPNRK